MKIIFDAEDFKNRPRGIVRTTLCLYNACVELDPSIRFAAITRKPIATVLPDFIDTVTLRPNMPRSIWRFIMFNAYLSGKSPSIIHFPSNGLIPVIPGRHKAVMTLHDILPMLIPGLLSRPGKLRRHIQRRQNDLDRSTIVFTVSEYSKRDIMRHFKVRSEPVVLYNAPTLPQVAYEPIRDISKMEDYFLYTGGYDQRKGLTQLLKVFLALHRERKISSKLFLTGSRSYYSQEFKDLTRDGVAMGIVRELDYVDDGELIGLMRRSKGLIYPSFYEGFGLPPIEAMNVGCPVITTPFSSIPEVCGDAALYVDPNRDVEFGDAIIALSTNSSLRNELIDKGKKQAGRYSWSKTASIFLDHLERLNAT